MMDEPTNVSRNAAQPENPAEAPRPDDVSQPPPLEEEVIKALKTVYDPEIPVNIYDLGLVYNIAVEDDGVVKIRMTLTSPACPVAGSLPPEVQQKVSAIPGVKEAQVDLTWEPPWNPSMMCEAAKLQLGFL
jgi:FeS assembly SUF system protein